TSSIRTWPREKRAVSMRSTTRRDPRYASWTFPRSRSRPEDVFPVIARKLSLFTKLSPQLSPIAASGGGVLEVRAALFPAAEALDGAFQLPFLAEGEDQDALGGHDDRRIPHADCEHGRVRQDEVPVLVRGLAHFADRAPGAD